MTNNGANLASHRKKERVRRFNPKSRGGCITCKVRHVKCDETKPECLRCQKFGRPCDGYEVKIIERLPRDADIQVAKAARPLAPKVSFLPVSTPPCPTGLCPIGARFDSEDEYRYYRLFRERTAYGLNGFLKKSLWERLILQACDTSESVRRAAIALAALDVATHLPNLQGKRLPSSPSDSLIQQGKLVHHQSALQQYHKALLDMVQRLESSTPDTRTALIFCLLVTCFETWTGNVNTAVAQISNGMQLVSEWLNANSGSLTSLDYELVEVFDQLENQALMSHNNRSLRRKPEFRKDMGQLASCMPNVFSDVDEARLYYEIQIRSRFNSADAKAVQKYTAEPSPDGTHILPLGRNTSLNPHFLIKPEQYAPEVHNKLLLLWQGNANPFRRWYQAFKPLLDYVRGQQNPPHPNLAQALSLELRYFTGFPLFAQNLTRYEITWDNATAGFLRIVRLAENIAALETSSQGSDSYPYSFTVDGAIIPSMFVVVTKCRHPYVRRRAIALLEARPRREAMWDAAVVARVGRLCIQIEERGLLEEDLKPEAGEQHSLPPKNLIIPEHKRIRGMENSYDLIERRGQMSYLEMNPLISEDRPTERFTRRFVDYTW